MSLYLVTGGAGFIGSNIVEELVKKGEGVRVIDNFITGSRDNIAPFKEIDLIEGDIRSKEDLEKALKDVDYVLHQAALRSVPKSVDDPFLTNDINVNGTLNLLFQAKKAGVKRLVNASSSAIYGDSETFPQKEDVKAHPISPYGVSKLAAENYCYAFAKTFGLETVSLRYFNVFGPRQNPESQYSAAIPALLSRMLNKRSPIAEWDGKQSRDFVFVHNIVNANLSAAVTKGVSGEALNVACGSSVSILDIIDMLNRILGTKLKPEYRPKREGDARKTYADVARMKDLLDLNDMIGFEEGLRRTTEWFKENKGKLLAI